MRMMVYGVVQGVGFRPAVHRLAVEMGLDGYVHNKGSCVEIVVNGDPEKFISLLKSRLSGNARIDRYEVLEGEPPKKGFYIVKSTGGDLSSPLPPDTALCEICVEELKTPGDRRYRYPFTNCTDCGARYSVIKGVPFDRERTSMDNFPLCASCTLEYRAPSNRRFHAQTISCPKCGPQYKLYNKIGQVMNVGDMFTVFALQIDQGDVGVLKSWGGAHVVCSVDNIAKLRDMYNRPQKPLAVMVRDMHQAEKAAVLTENARKLLLSPQRPIVLVKKKGGVWVEQAAPGLDRVGIYLPYSASHHLLFESLAADAVVMTSANLPGQPMALLNQDCLELPADIYLLHNRQIINRMDDSLVLPRGRAHFFLRKSRGFVPMPMDVGHERTFVAMGGDMNGCGCVSRGGRAIPTQYIGDVGNYDVSVFLEKAISNMMVFSGIKPEKLEAVVVDKHPRYGSRRVGKSLSAKWDTRLLEVQHHVAHLYCLMGEHKRQEMVAITADGTGWGDDGTIWGGEVLAAESNDEGYVRLGRLQPIPLIGGEKALEEPARLVAAACWTIGLEQPYFSKKEEGVLKKAMKNSILSSSSGRFLDLVATWLGVCQNMSYDGEPAMKLEAVLNRGKDDGCWEADIKNKDGIMEVQTMKLLESLAEEQLPLGYGRPMPTKDAPRLVISTVKPVFQALADVAAEAARDRGLKHVGFTGGVSYNLVIDRIVEKRLREHGISMLRHRALPNGDGGVAFGQIVWAGRKN
ncbi:MAG: carbamoyltransferase HypF [Candidatus Thermoplasmatota archaeon]|nr:carbamoyltransferase HypF [Candidatus Thermoplasmatota archaeon]